MTKRRALDDAAGSAIGYAIALVALVLWPGRVTATQIEVVLVGAAIYLVVYLAVDRVVFGHQFREMFRRAPRGRRAINWPNGLGIFLAVMAGQLLRDLPEAGLATFAVGMGLIQIGSLASNWLTAARAAPAAADHAGSSVPGGR